MTEKERLTDFILSEKKMSTNYDIFASECVSTNLRNDFVSNLTTSHQTQTDLFNLSVQKGWYQVEPAPQEKIQQAYTKFSNAQP